MSRRYPEYTSGKLIAAQFVASLGITGFLFFSLPARAPVMTRLLLSSGGIGICLLTTDITLDYLKHTYKKTDSADTKALTNPKSPNIKNQH